MAKLSSTDRLVRMAPRTAATTDQRPFKMPRRGNLWVTKLGSRLLCSSAQDHGFPVRTESLGLQSQIELSVAECLRPDRIIDRNLNCSARYQGLA